MTISTNGSNASSLTKAKVLVLDDDKLLLRLIAVLLEREHYELIAVEQADEVLRALYQSQPDVILLDVHLPQTNGIEICRRIREMSDAPVIMLSGSHQEEDVLAAFAAGADDYVRKPFVGAELIARIRAHLRRRQRQAETPNPALLVVGEVAIDTARHKVRVRNQPVELTPTEFKLLVYLARHAHSVVRHAQLLAAVWGPEYIDQLDYLRLYIRYLRRKIECDPSCPQIIKTERGIGYYLSG